MRRRSGICDVSCFTSRPSKRTAGSSCRKPNDEDSHHGWSLDDGRTKTAHVFVATGQTTHQPAWETVGRYTLLTALVGGAIAGEAYCFAECDSGGKIALGVTDVVVPLVAVLVVFTFIGVGLGAGG